MKESLTTLLSELSACAVCAQELPCGPRPIVQLTRKAQVVIIGQAPGRNVHESGVPWDDASGEHLREWLNVSRSEFYDATRFAFIPMGFCYPGKKSGGDAPPRPECAPLWHDRLLEQLPTTSLLVLVGQYAQKYYLSRAARDGDAAMKRKSSLTETVRCYEQYLPRYFPLPHPSWRSKGWMQKNPWFSQRVLPALRIEVGKRG